MEKYNFVITKKNPDKMEYLGLYDNEHQVRKAFLNFSNGLNKEPCDELYHIIVFITDTDHEQIIYEEKPSRMKWYQAGDKEE